MATFSTTSGTPNGAVAQKSLREDLANWISNISRDMTPFVSSIGKAKATQTLHEWSTDTLDAPTLQAKPEGSVFSEEGGPVVKRIGNRTQIFSKGIVVTGTLEAADKAGRKSEFKYQSAKRGKEMMRDLEKVLVSAQMSTASATGSGRVVAGSRLMGGYRSYAAVGVTPAVSLTAATGDFAKITNSTGDGSDVASAANRNAADSGAGTGTLADAAFTLDNVNEVLRQIAGETSATPSTIMLSTVNKVAFSDLVNTPSLNVRRNIDEKGKLRQSIDWYESDFGLVKLVPNYIMDDTELFVYDPSLMSVASFRPVHFRDINEVGDAMRSYMVMETTFEAKSPTGNGVIFGVA